MMEVQQYMLDKIGDFKAKVCNPEAHLNNMASCDKEFKRMWKRDKESIDYAGITNNAKVMDGLSTLFQTNFFRLFFRYCTGV